MKLKVIFLPLLLMVIQLKVDLLVEKKYKKPIRDIFYIATVRRAVQRPQKIITVAQAEKPDVIEYYGNTKGQRGVVAVLSLNGEVYTVREGEVFGNNYRVIRIFPDQVILRDEKNGKKIIVKLKEG